MSADTPNPGKDFSLPYTHRLHYPVAVGTEPLTEIVFVRRLVAKDLKGIPAEGLTLDHMVLLIARVVGKPVAIIEQIDAADIVELAEVVQSFLPSSQKTGMD